MKRIFIALPVRIEYGFLEAYHDIKDKLMNEAIKWVDERNMHLTLKFLGDTEEDKIREIKEGLIQVAGNFNRFDFSLKGFGYFGSKRQPTVLFVGIYNQEILKQLALQVDNFTNGLGFEPETRHYKAHLTIGRIKFLKDNAGFLKTVGSYENKFFQTVTGEELILFESILSREGPVYKSLQALKFI